MEVRSQKASDKCLVMMTCINGWEHLSVSHSNKIPSWLCMQEMKEMFFKDDEECFQFHPKKEYYINNNEYTLHIWKKTDGEMEPPPYILVGFRPGHEEEDLEIAKKLHEDIGCPLSEQDAQMLLLASSKDGLGELDKQMKNMAPQDFFKLCRGMGLI